MCQYERFTGVRTWYIFISIGFWLKDQEKLEGHSADLEKIGARSFFVVFVDDETGNEVYDKNHIIFYFFFFESIPYGIEWSDLKLKNNNNIEFENILSFHFQHPLN